MLCRCSQQERVIAVGVWSSPRRFGSSGQSCQKLPKDPPGYTRVLLPSAGRISVWSFILHVLQTHHMHICEGRDARASLHQRRPSLASPLTAASGRPAGSVTVTVAFPGPVSAITRAPRTQQASPRSGSSPAMSAEARGTNWGGYGVTEERKSDKLGVI